MTGPEPIPPADGASVPAERDYRSNLPAPPTVPAPRASAWLPASDGDEIDLRDVWVTLKRRKGTVFATIAILTAAVAAYTVMATPVWYAKTLILVDEQVSGMLASPALSALTGIPGAGSQIDTEMRIVQTRPIVEDVVDAHDLNLVVTSPRHVPRALLFAALDFGRETVEGNYQIRPVGSGRYRIRSAGDDDPQLDTEFSPGDRIEIPGGSFVLSDLAAGRDHGGESLPTEVDLKTVPFQEAVADLSETMAVDRPNRDAAVLQVGYRTTDRTLVHQVPNAIAENFIARRIDTQKADAMSTVAFLEGQVEETRQQLEGVEAELQSFREGEQIVALGAEAAAQVTRLATLQAQRTQLEAERSALAGLVADIDDTTERPDYRRLASFPTFFANDAIVQLLVRLIEADQTRTELLSRLTPRHPDVIALDTRIGQLEDQLGAIGRNYLRSVSDQIAALDTVLARFGAELEQVPAREIVTARIERQVDMLAELYTLLQTRLKEAQVKEAIDDSSVRIVEHAIQPLQPVSPRPVRAVALAMMLGLVLGVVLAFIREYMDRRLQSSDRIETLYGLPTIARIPWLALDNGREGRASGLVTLTDAGSIAAESFRNLRTKVGFVAGGRGADEIVITSPSPGEGKSLTAANLAVALAQRGVSTLLVDADLRRPVQHAQFGSDQSPGLAEYLRADVLMDEVIRPTMLDTLFVLPAGRCPPNPAELLDSARMDRLLDTLRDRFGTVILDAPPVLAAMDSAVLAPRTDGVILVVRAGKTDKDAIALAIQQLRQVGAELLGIVVGDARAEDSYQAYFNEDHEKGPAEFGNVRSLIQRIKAPFS